MIARFCVNLPTFHEVFDTENFQKMLNYAFLRIKAQYVRTFDEAACFSFHRPLK